MEQESTHTRSKKPDSTAANYDAIEPLIEMCKAGQLFEVQDWIAEGKPVNYSPRPKGSSKRSPLYWAIKRGFHSLVQVLLNGGASVNDNTCNILGEALATKRLDLIKLLVEYGADINSIGMTWVFETWDPSIIEYFIEQGADVETDYPLAAALCSKIRTALGVFKRHKDQFPSFQEQLNIALRHHCMEGSLKWVSLLIWAGADPYAKGLGSSLDTDEEEYLCALEYAALYGHYEIFDLKIVHIDPDHPIANQLLLYACYSKTVDFLEKLIERGLKPADQADRGSSLIQRCLHCLPWSTADDFFMRKRKDIDSYRSRQTLKMIQILAQNGAKWFPEKNEIKDARWSLLKMTPDYTVEFLAIMSKHSACSRESIEQLLRTPTIKKHVAEYKSRMDKIMTKFSPMETV